VAAVTAQESEVLSIIRYRGTSKIAGKLFWTCFYSFPAIFEVPLYLIIDRTSDSCGRVVKPKIEMLINHPIIV
jgi:hypothetical protein